MLRPRNVERVEPLGHGFERRKLMRRDLGMGYDDEADIVVLVRISDRERTLEVCPAEALGESRLCAHNQVVQYGVQIEEGSQGSHGTRYFSGLRGGRVCRSGHTAGSDP